MRERKLPGRSHYEKQEDYKRRLEESKQRRRISKDREVKRSMLGIMRHMDPIIKKFIYTSGMSVNTFVDFCSTHEIDQLDFNHIARIQKQDVFCLCFFDNINKEFYIRPLIIAEETDENRDIDLSQSSLMNKPIRHYFESESISVKIFDPIWLASIVSYVFKKSEDTFLIEFKTRSGYRSFFSSIFFSRNSCGFSFELGYKDVWCSTLQKDLGKVLVNLSNWHNILLTVSDCEVWFKFKTFTFFPCLNIATWRKIVEYCRSNKQLSIVDENSFEEKNLVKLCKSIKDTTLKFRNSVSLEFKSVTFLGITLHLTDNFKRANFLTILKSLGLLEEFEEDTAFVQLTTV